MHKTCKYTRHANIQNKGGQKGGGTLNDAPVVVHEEILRLEVAVRHTEAVDVLEGRDDAPRVELGLLDVEPARLGPRQQVRLLVDVPGRYAVGPGRGILIGRGKRCGPRACQVTPSASWRSLNQRSKHGVPGARLVRVRHKRRRAGTAWVVCVRRACRVFIVH